MPADIKLDVSSVDTPVRKRSRSPAVRRPVRKVLAAELTAVFDQQPMPLTAILMLGSVNLHPCAVHTAGVSQPTHAKLSESACISPDSHGAKSARHWALGHPKGA